MPDAPTLLPIVFCITELDPGGAERALFNLVTRLDREIFDPTVISLSGTGVVGDWLRERGIEVIELKANGKLDFFAWMRLVKELQRIKPVIIQGFLFQANLQSRLAGYWAKVPLRFAGIRVAERRSNLFHLLDRWTERLVEKHICVSAGVKAFSQQVAGLDAQKLMVIPNGVDIERIVKATPLDRAEFNLCAGDFISVSAGRLDPQKGYDFLLKTIAAWSNRPANFKLLIAGIGPERVALKKQIVHLNLQDVVQLVGYRADLPGLLKMCDLYIQSSRYEGMCNAVLEALAASKKVLTTKVEGVDELLGIPGLMPPVLFGDELGFIKLLEQSIEPALVESNGDEEPQHTDIKSFTWNNVAEKYAAVYLDAIAKRRKQ